jgi:hypothetical protein
VCVCARGAPPPPPTTTTTRHTHIQNTLSLQIDPALLGDDAGTGRRRATMSLEEAEQRRRQEERPPPGDGAQQ